MREIPNFEPVSALSIYLNLARMTVEFEIESFKEYINDTKQSIQKQQDSFNSMFEEQKKKYPDNIAELYGTTYGDKNYQYNEFYPATFNNSTFLSLYSVFEFNLKNLCITLQSKETIMQFGNDSKHLGAQMGIISVLHTWGQNLSLHPHVHMIIPGGGITKAGNWKHAKNDGKYLFCVKALSKVYQGKFMEKLKDFLQTINQPMSLRFKGNLYNKKWVVDARQPFLGPKQVIEYLGRYSHKIAISNHRIKKVENGQVTFSYKDYAHGSVQRLLPLDAEEFLRRFCLHILPPKYMKIRHYGILASRTKPRLKMQQMKMGVLIVKKEKQDWKEITKTRLGFDVETCPCCKTGRMIRVMSFDANAPPLKINNRLLLKNQQN